jgi:predicted metal-dependent enzyme (double-stranded beta helix superfamily)
MLMTSFCLADFCDRIGMIVARHPRPELPARVAELLPELLASDDLLAPAQRAVPPHGYGRHALFVCPSRSFSLVAAVWPPGITTPIHDHRAWCAFGVYDGVVRETRFAPTEERAGVCYAAPVETVACAAGCVRHLPADGPDIHAMHNPGDRVAVSIHVYGEDAARLGPNVETVYSLVG